MSDKDCQYCGLMVETWDLLRGDTSKWSSRPYFLEIIKHSGEPILDVACGTGRLLVDYLKEGIGNLIQAIPSIKALTSMKYKIDAWVDPTLEDGFELVKHFPAINKIYKKKPKLQKYNTIFSTYGKKLLKNH